MRSIKTENGTEIKFYASAKELNMQRYTELQKYLTIESGIGSSIDSINTRYLRMKAFIEEGKKEDALLENENALFAIRGALNGVSYLTLSFACLVASIGGEACEDVTEDGLQAVAEKLRASGITFGVLDETVEEIKKK